MQRYRDAKIWVCSNDSTPLTQFYINFLRQEHQIEVFYVSFNVWDSQVSSYTPFHFSFTVPLKPLSVLEYRDMYVDETLSKPPCIHLKIPVCAVLSSDCTQRILYAAELQGKRVSISLDTHISVLNEHTKFLRVPL